MGDFGGCGSDVRPKWQKPTVLIMALTLAAISCSPVSATSRSCDVRGARFAIGKPFTEALARRARAAAGAHVLRKLEPGAIYTMEYSPVRLNLEVDRRGSVIAVRCG